MATTDRKSAGFEVVEEGDGFGVRREGDPQPISHHATREEAEAAARMHSGQGSEVDARHDLLPGEGDDPSSAKRTFSAVALFAVAVVLLIVIISLIVALG